MRFLFALTAALLISASAQAQQSFNLLVNRNSNMLDSIDSGTACSVFAGQIISWGDLPDSGLSGDIEAIRLVDTDPAMQAFKDWSGLTTFGDNVTVITGGQAPLFLAALAASRPNVFAVNQPSPVLAGDKVLQQTP